MIPGTTAPAMPMASRLPITQADLMPATAAAPPAPPAPPMPAAAPAPMAGPGGTSLGGFNPPGAPAEPPYTIRTQPDGSAVWVSKTSPEVVIAVVPAPKLPVSMQPPKPTQ